MATTDPHTTRRLLRTARHSTDPSTLDKLARQDVPTEVLARIAHNPATSEPTLVHLVERDERWLTFAVTHRTDLDPAVLDHIARRLTNRLAIYHATSAPNALPETLRYLAAHPDAPRGAVDQANERLGTAPLAVA